MALESVGLVMAPWELREMINQAGGRGTGDGGRGSSRGCYRGRAVGTVAVKVTAWGPEGAPVGAEGALHMTIILAGRCRCRHAPSPRPCQADGDGDGAISFEEPLTSAL